MLQTTPKISGGGSWVTEYQTALTQSEKPSTPSLEKPGFVSMTTNAGTTVSENYLVANGKDWISELKAMSADNRSEEKVTYSSGEGTGIFQNLSLDLSTDYVPSKRMRIPRSEKFFFGVLASSNEWENFDITPKDKVSVSIKFGAVAKVPVQPDPHWYDANFLNTLAKRDSWNPPFTRANIFGEDGLLSVMLNGFTAAYRMSYKVQMSPETYQKFESRFVAARGFRIGLFKFGPGNSLLTAGAFGAAEPPRSAGWEHHANPDTNTFEGKSSADFPSVVGATVIRIVPDN